MFAKINLPAFLEERLHDATHEPAVRKALQEFGKWFDESKQTFFPDYTNHGIQHIEQVLDTVANLIPATAETSFSKDDAAALILAVLLHDSALHLSKAGFWNLIKGPDQYAHLPFFDRAGWGQTWADFMFLARRWDDAMLANVFGKDETGAPRAQVRDPFEHWQNLTETDNLLIGEFIRKHHPRLAHEMALYGVPGPNGAYLTLNDLPAQWRDLVGLVARSHGLPLRSGLDYLKKTPHFGTFAHRDYRNVHAVYLMALLRVGDYIQIQGDRTSERVFEYKDIRSLVSQVEHKAHLSDIIITDKTDDPESLQIDAHPQEVAVFLRLKEWLAGIQQELDSSWAVLGEVYGLQPKLKNLGLTFRRVRSNLDDVAEFAKTVPYVPDRIRFDVARAELLKLLIGPLYGDDPSYGVRELMQNSIDAVREYDQFVLDNPEYVSVPRREQKADVVVELGPFDEATGYATMTISDRGIGMSEATIRDYFLRAGASYRQNLKWRAAFEHGNAKGAASKVLRSGRFGVGALAAFLIGVEIEVETRFIADAEGYSFTTTLQTETISLSHCKSIAVGTRIKAKISKENYQKLLKSKGLVTRPAFWDWYCFSYPSVQRIYYPQGKGRTVAPAAYSFDEKFRTGGWHKLPLQEPYDVYWTREKAPNLLCNGFFVSDNGFLNNVTVNTIPRQSSGNSYYALSYPHMCIIDPDGKFPLNLQRDALAMSEYPFGQVFIKELLTEMLAYVFFKGPEALNSPIIPGTDFGLWLSNKTPSVLVACAKGYGVGCSTLLHELVVSHIVHYLEPSLKVEFLRADSLVFGSGISAHSWYKNSYDSALLGFTIKYEATYSDLQNKAGVRMVARKILLAGEDPGSFTVEKESPSFAQVATKQLEDNPGFSVGDWLSTNNSNELALLERFYPPNTFIDVTTDTWLLDKLWQKYFGKNWIPFALEDRIAKFPEAAKFFKERYPQVVPDKAWALLGGKPAAGK